MPFESACEVISGLENGNKVYGVQRIYAVMLTPGTDDATLQLSWTSRRFGGTRHFNLRADSTGSSVIYQPVKPLVVDANVITITKTGTSSYAELGVAGYTGGTTGANLVCRVTKG